MKFLVNIVALAIILEFYGVVAAFGDDPSQYLDDEAWKDSLPKLRICIEGGLEHRIGQVSRDLPPNIRRYAEELKTGTDYSFSLAYIFGKEIGFGFEFLQFNSSNSTDHVIVNSVVDGTVVAIGTLENNINLSTYSLCLLVRRSFSERKIYLVGSFSMGMLSYRDNASLLGMSFKTTGVAISTGGTMGFDFFIGKSVTLGFDVRYFSGLLIDLEMNDVPVPSEEWTSLDRIGICIGIRMYR
ncbi:MAG: hypothetical protein A2268_15530 [Candidatus Raymondbacteria bacterium RifOxyA12_full_50_37]|uniref:Outer membrane protein beta-barrel domain-containing protein n=1 Tax=Candidatus Raymondbacteria bacterium RIFOXYD12_FULL_49_13 TaxID=1817890 RepID=A0A1F7F3Y7_UNCRA|nr:MAG: hypothetical protein A2268_15530 [Candidatus Raymondbacteria bacterium RifOxyA12_full_50_37]OGJ88436.1 MAG: hypothetical protein A2248_19735 [Candidatus Raymondbacteria bacterium RIFOXYA2_FULL_49_16]OGJ93104.1 MAG: hypothetical protein A2487_09020 [Candidatus Raymondbacteria bacterium RifOxyC12_full_50_8]OGJ98896.1 MAG: hypothetical protein A2453_10450 [Candidatus Raymondbacteria bacterium RIFOXYC2_FULL_50_21]OGK01247.1 MAG: hypothetical protein A2519_22600 [Candidatus Raymondbacteria b